MRLDSFYKMLYEVTSVYLRPGRAEKQKINEKIKVGDQLEEVDDSGFYAGKASTPEFQDFSSFFVSSFPSSSCQQEARCPRMVCP